MAKFLVLYNSSMQAAELMAKSSPEQMKAGMDSWIAWKAEAEKTVKFEFGMPLQPSARITPAGEAASDTEVSGYSIMEGDKEAVVEALKTHPHLEREDASIDLLEMLSMPGM